MSDRSFERAVSEWLESGSDGTPPAVIDAVLLAVKTTPQERDLRIPRRLIPMTNSMRLAAVLAAVAVAGVAGLSLIGPGPGPGVEPTPTLPPVPASPAPLRAGVLDPGSYSHDGDGVRVTLTVPAGWVGSSSWGLGKPPFELPDGVNLGFRQPSRAFSDPCTPVSTGLDLTVDDLVRALADLPNVTAQATADVTISGFSGKLVTFTVNTEGIDCVMALYQQDAFVRAAENGQDQRLWILDVAGTRLVIDGATFPDTSADDRAELQTIVDTLVIEPID